MFLLTRPSEQTVRRFLSSQKHGDLSSAYSLAKAATRSSEPQQRCAGGRCSSSDGSSCAGRPPRSPPAPTWPSSCGSGRVVASRPRRERRRALLDRVGRVFPAAAPARTVGISVDTASATALRARLDGRDAPREPVTGWRVFSRWCSVGIAAVAKVVATFGRIGTLLGNHRRIGGQEARREHSAGRPAAQGRQARPDRTGRRTSLMGDPVRLTVRVRPRAPLRGVGRMLDAFPS